MNLDSIYVLNIESYLGLAEIEEKQQFHANQKTDPFTYYCSAEGWLKGCSFPMEMINTDSMNDLSTETFQLAGQQMAI